MDVHMSEGNIYFMAVDASVAEGNVELLLITQSQPLEQENTGVSQDFQVPSFPSTATS